MLTDVEDLDGSIAYTSKRMQAKTSDAVLSSPTRGALVRSFWNGGIEKPSIAFESEPLMAPVLTIETRAIGRKLSLTHRDTRESLF